MGDIWARDLPKYLTKWKVAHRVQEGADTRSRSSGGMDAMQGVIVHHSASGLATSYTGSITYMCYNAVDRPIGNGVGSRTPAGPLFTLTTCGAANTAGKGGPVLSHRGVIPLDSANRRTFSVEWENNGIGEPWTDEVCDLYVKVVVAVLDWANNETPGAKLDAGDVWAHFEWTNPLDPYGATRKIDPFGPCRWNGQSNRKWNMDLFRADVMKLLGTLDIPVIQPGPVATYTVQSGEGWWTVSQKLGYSISELQAFNNMLPPDDMLHPGDVIKAPGSSPTNWQAVGAAAATPTGSPYLEYGVVHDQCVTLQAILCSMNTLPADGATPIYNPAWVGADMINGVSTPKGYGTALKNSVTYWQSKNGLVADGEFGPVTAARMKLVRGK